MPLPRISRPPPSPAASISAARKLLFVSYSHADMAEYGATFIKYLSLKIRGHPDLGYAESDIYFDQNQLKAGQYWDESIQTALEQAGALIFLVSHNSLFSKYCMEREVGTAVQRGIPIIPVVLQPCPWEEQSLPGDPLKRQLGAIGALPKTADFSLLPVKNWPDMANAWDATVDQIAEALLGEAAAPAAPALRARAAALPPLLPYFCDQQRAESEFNRGMLGWSGVSMLVLIKGVIEDRPPRFWDRLREKNLAGYSTARRQLPVLEQRALNWPSAWDGARVRKEMDADVLFALSDAITGNPFDIVSPAVLADRLDKLCGVLPLLATLPDEPAKALAASLQALLRVFEACPAHAQLDRLVIAFVIEDDDLIAEANLAKHFKLSSHPRTLLVELDRLQELTREEVRIWHRNQGLDKYCCLDEQSLVAAVFENTETLRFGQFEARLKPLLGI
jgi:hypothetical protein